MVTRKFNGNTNIVSEIIRRERIKQNMSLSDLSNKLQLLGVCLYKSDLFLIENNRRTVKDFELIALFKVLKIDYTELDKVV